jgi:hypothetical protein
MTVEADLRDLMDDVLEKTKARRKAALDDAVFPLSQLVTVDGLSVCTALDGLRSVAKTVGHNAATIDTLTMQLVRAVGTPSQNGKSGSKKIGHVIDLFDVTPERQEWLWIDWIPEGELTVVEGRKATGKSTVVSDITARKLAGLDMPDGTTCHAGVVGYLCGEESLSRTVRRRVDHELKRFGLVLEPSQLIILDSVEDEHGERGYEIPGDLEVIEEKVKTHGIELLVIDVLDNFLGDRVDTHSNHSVRRALGPLAKLAQRLNITIIVIRHLRKGQEGLALDQGMGSVGIGAQARSIIRADHHPDKEGQRVLAVVECNVALKPLSRGYVISPVEDDFGTLGELSWTGVESLTAEDLASAKPGRAREAKAAGEWLDDLLDEHGGRVDAKVVEALVRDEDFSLRTLKRAKKEKQIASVADKSPDGKTRCWFWQRPDWEPPDDEVSK